MEANFKHSFGHRTFCTGGSLIYILPTYFPFFQELNNVCEPVVTQPKPKVDSPKDENPLSEQSDYKTEDMGEDDKNSEMPQQNGECHPSDQNTINMDLD